MQKTMFVDLNDPERDVDLISIGGIEYEFGSLTESEAQELTQKVLSISVKKGKTIEERTNLAIVYLDLRNNIPDNFSMTEAECKQFILLVNKAIYNASDSHM